MTNTLRKVALQVTIPLLCGLIVLNTYFVAKNLNRVQKNIAQRVEASQVQAGISNLLVNLQDMETGQRAYLITGDPAYRQSYNDASGKLAAELAGLRSRLMTSRDRSLAAQLESVAESKIAEMNETIRLRELGYRHRAFLIVSSNRGQALMDEARSSLQALSSAQTANLARYDRETRESIARAIRQSALATLVLLAVTVIAFLGFNRYQRRLEVGYARQAQELQATSLRLEQFTSTIFHDIRSLAAQTRNYANTLLDVYGGFLPRQGQDKAECIEHGASQILRLLDDLSGNSGNSGAHEPVEVVAEEPLHSLTA